MILCDYLREKQRIIILFIIIISSWLIFPSLWIEIINNLLVNPILSKMGGTTILYDCLFGLIGLFSIIYSLYACRYKKQINYNNIMLVIFLTIGYSYFRFVQVEKWEFFTTATFPNIFYSDVFFILIITQALMLFAVKYKESKIFRDPQLSIFQVDNINTIIDKYKRNEYIDLLGRELCKSFYPNSAFSIIIDGDWGSGKSYFLETLKNNVSNKNKDILLIDFKPWFCKTPNEIIDEFFKQYKRELNKYDSSLSSNIKSYSSLLITDSEGVLDKIISSFGLFTDSLNIQSEYNEIHSKLVRLKQEVIIFIDDLDRLDENEIVEVLRLIRNTANFPYTQFIVAADKDYIQAALESKNISNPIKYLDKIFNMDISLPKFEEKVICEELASELQKFFQEEFPMFSNTKIDDIVLMCIKEDNFDNYNLVIPKILKTMRDVKRFLNQYKINLKVTFEKINKKERLVWKYSPVNIYNFFILELIKYRFYSVYEILRENPYSLLKQENKEFSYYSQLSSNAKRDRNSLFFGNFGEIAQREIEKDSILKKDIDNTMKVLQDHLKEDDLIVVDILLKHLFTWTDYVEGNNIDLRDIRNYFNYFAFRSDRRTVIFSEFLKYIYLENIENVCMSSN